MILKVLAVALFIFGTSTCKVPTKNQSQLEADRLAQGSGPGNQHDMFRVGNRTATSPHGDNYLDEIQPTFNKYCVSCHACYEAPCQVNMQSYLGVRRGYNPEPIFGAERKTTTVNTNLRALPQTGPMGTDPATKSVIDAWRNIVPGDASRQFHPVVAHADEKETFNQPQNWKNSVMAALLESAHKRQPNYESTRLESLQKFGRDRGRYQCVASNDQFRKYFKSGFLGTGGGSNPWDVQSVDAFLKNEEYMFAGRTTVGMPFGFGNLPDPEHQKLMAWLEKGAIGPSADAQRSLTSSSNQKEIGEWEAFLNTPSAQGRLTARYIYEHAYKAKIALDEAPGEFYNIVRINDKGQIFETNHPYQLPAGITEFKYALAKIDKAIVQKDHILWRVNRAKLAHLKAMFLDTKWPGKLVVPPYTSNNPFKNFEQIPAHLRAQFMFENSHIIVGAMVQAAVCTGEGATYAIQEHFWVWFLRPEVDPSVQNPSLSLTSLDDLNTANLGGQEQTYSVAGNLAHYRRTTKANRSYAVAWEQSMRELLAKQQRKGLKVTDLWDGTTPFNPGVSVDPYYKSTVNASGANPNAFLTVLRHGESSTVHFGNEGNNPQSIWVMSYSNFERLYYNLVAHFEEYGNLLHRMATWRHMSYARGEGEDLGLSFLPASQEIRKKLRSRFHRGLFGEQIEYNFPVWSLEKDAKGAIRDTEESYQLNAESPEDNTIEGKAAAEFRQKGVELILKGKPLMSHNNNVADVKGRDSQDYKLLKTLTAPRRKEDLYQTFMPDLTVIRVRGDDGREQFYSLLSDRGYKAHDIVVLEKQDRDPSLDTLSLYLGLVGAYPNLFIDLPAYRFKTLTVSDFVEAVKSLRSPADYNQLRLNFGMRRASGVDPKEAKAKNPDFWTFVSSLHRWKGAIHDGNDPIEQGIVDLSQYEMY